MPQVSISPALPTGGLDGPSFSIGNTVTVIKSGAGQIYGWHIYNSNSAAVYVQFFDVVNAGVINLGVTPPRRSFGIPALGAAAPFGRYGLQFYNGIWCAVTTTRTGSSNPANTVDCDFFVK